MKKRVSDQLWFPFWVDKWIFGSMRIECTLEERAIWIDLLAFASKDEGYIRANEETPYLIQQLVGMLLIPEDKLKPAIKKFIKLRKLEEPTSGIYRIATWEKYQLSESYHRVQKHREKEDDKPVSNGKKLQCNEKPLTYYNKINKNTLNNNKIKESKSLCLEKFQDEDIRLTQLLIDKMTENNPNSSILRRLTPKRQEIWIDECRKLREIDKRMTEQIEQIIIFSQDDSFWKANILSMPKLREKFDQLWLKAKKEKFAGIKEWLNEL